MDDGTSGLGRSRPEVEVGLAYLLTGEGEDGEGGELRANGDSGKGGAGGSGDGERVKGSAGGVSEERRGEEGQ